MFGTVQALRKRGVLLVHVTLVCGTAVAFGGRGGPLILQGSTTFNRRVMEPYEAAIEAKSGQDITVIPNRTMLGIIALLEGRAHMAMISASLESEIGKMKKAMPGLDYDRLKVFEISSTRVAFVVNPAIPLGKASLDQIKKILTGQITNWNALGGKDAPIRLVIVGGGGSVVTTVEAELSTVSGARRISFLSGRPCNSPVRGAGAECARDRAISLAKQKGLPEVVAEKPVEQTLSLITLGEPTPAMKAVIDAARQAVKKTM